MPPIDVILSSTSTSTGLRPEYEYDQRQDKVLCPKPSAFCGALPASKLKIARTPRKSRRALSAGLHR
jgi:hypothetical protein